MYRGLGVLRSSTILLISVKIIFTAEFAENAEIEN
jgi:hypothetical protein